MVNKGKILVVEDESINSILLKRILTKEGYEVKVTQNGLEALEVLKWNFEHTQVIDSNMQSDFFNLNMNIITELENFK